MSCSQGTQTWAESPITFLKTVKDWGWVMDWTLSEVSVAHLGPGTALTALPCPGVTLGAETRIKSLLWGGSITHLDFSPTALHLTLSFKPVPAHQPCRISRTTSIFSKEATKIFEIVSVEASRNPEFISAACLYPCIVVGS